MSPYFKKYRYWVFLFFIFFLFSIFGQSSYAEENKEAGLFISPSRQTVLIDSTFDVSFYLNTKGSNINAVELNIKFSPGQLNIVKPSSGKSFISIWPEPAYYSNTEGAARFVGGIPNGITTGSGLITTITFRAKASGRAVIEILPSSKVLANDGLGTNIVSEFGRADYIIESRPPEGPKVFSQTHSFESDWYNNNNPVVSWEKEPGVSEFSFEINNEPFTVPDNEPDTWETIKSYQDLSDGLWYFHIKAKKENIWGSATHFLMRIDSTPPASFKPKVEVLTAAVINRALVSFSTTDSLSGIDHYEVGIIDKTKSPLESPVFFEAESPYQLPTVVSKNLRVIVRAIDRAGNVRDEVVDVHVPLSLRLVFIIILAIIFILIGSHYLFAHKIIYRLIKVFKFLKNKRNRL